MADTYWICPLCGPRIVCDEDGCCATCGSTSFGSEEEWYLEAIAAATKTITEERNAARKTATKLNREKQQLESQLAKSNRMSLLLDLQKQIEMGRHELAKATAALDDVYAENEKHKKELAVFLKVDPANV